jgi:hypothetical protein
MASPNSDLMFQRNETIIKIAIEHMQFFDTTRPLSGQRVCHCWSGRGRRGVCGYFQA